MIEALVLGFHLGSYHAPARDYHSNVNPGIYVRADKWQAGFYLNSYRRETFYAGRSFDLGPVDLMVGVATGYKRKCQQWEVQTKKNVIVQEECRGFSKHSVTPLAALSYAVPVTVMGGAPRIWALPGFGKASSVVHASIEWSIK